MENKVSSFGEYLSGWMTDNHISASSLNEKIKGTSTATILRLMRDQLSYQRCARFITELQDAVPDINANVLKNLRVCIDVNRYGKSLFIAQRDFLRVLSGNALVQQASGQEEEGDLSPEIISWAEGQRFQVLCLGLTNDAAFHTLTRVHQLHPEVSIRQFFWTASVEQPSSMLVKMLALAFDESYELYHVEARFSAMMNNAIVVRREDGCQLLIAFDGVEYKLLRIDSATPLFDFLSDMMMSGNLRIQRLNAHYEKKTPEVFFEKMRRCAEAEGDADTYYIQSDIPLEYMPVSALYESFLKWAEDASGGEEKKDEFVELCRKRHENRLNRKAPSYVILSRSGLRKFAQTGCVSDHPACLAPFTLEQRAEIISYFIKLAESSAQLVPLVLNEKCFEIQYSLACYGTDCLMMAPAGAGEKISGYTELSLFSATLCEQFSGFVTNIIVKNYAGSKKAAIEYLHSLLRDIGD